MTNQLIALFDGREVGTVHYKNARLSFLYSDTWRADPNAYPLSLSMPLASAEHGHARIEAFLWGLLPDNDRVLENWGRRFQVSPRNVFRLITGSRPILVRNSTAKMRNFVATRQAMHPEP